MRGVLLVTAAPSVRRCQGQRWDNGIEPTFCNAPAAFRVTSQRGHSAEFCERCKDLVLRRLDLFGAPGVRLDVEPLAAEAKQ